MTGKHKNHNNYQYCIDKHCISFSQKWVTSKLHYECYH